MARKKKTNKPITHVAIILDRSGSMAVCEDETVSGYNEQLQKIRSSAKKNDMEDSTFFTIVLFNHQVEVVRFADPVSTLGTMSADFYNPDGTTAMLDAVGQTMDRYTQVVADSEDASYLFIIISDGQENDSKEYTYERVAEMIQKRQKTGRWTFSYMGANQDLSKLSKRLSIPRSNMAAYTADAGGTQVGFGSVSKSMMGYMDKRATGTHASDQFFRESDEIKSVEEDDDDSGGGPLLH